MKSQDRRNFRLDAKDKAEYREAVRLLDGSMSVLEAAKLAMQVAGHKPKAAGLNAGAACEAFLTRTEAKLSAGQIRPATYTFYEEKLDRFVRKFGDHKLDDIDRPTLRGWLESQPMSTSSQACIFRAVRAMYRDTLAQDPPGCSSDPTAGISFKRARKSSDAAFLSVDEAEACMRVQRQHVPFMALLLFAGVRPSEIADKAKPWLEWRHIDFDARLVRIPPEIGKNRERVIEGLPDTLWLWLEPFRDSKGTVASVNWQTIVQHAQRLGGFVTRTRENRTVNKPWPHDATRKSFITYHVALCQSAEATSLIVGHEGRTSLIHNTYRGLATKAEAERYFAIKP